MKNEIVQKKLIKITKESCSSIRKEVAREALYHSYTNICDFFSDLTRNGCICGMISILIYYRDTHAFFLKYYDQIEVLRNEYEQSTGLTLQPQGDLMNWYSWFAFEETARRLSKELGISQNVCI